MPNQDHPASTPTPAQFRIAIAAQGLTCTSLAVELGVPLPRLSEAIRRPDLYPSTRALSARLAIRLGLSADAAIPYNPALLRSSTGVTLPIELHNFCRAEVAAGRASNIAAMFVKALEDARREHIIAFINGAPSRQKGFLAKPKNPGHPAPTEPTSRAHGRWKGKENAK